MARQTRRSFLKAAALAGFGMPLIRTNAFAGPNDQLRVASIGPGGKGWSDLNNVAESPHVRVMALCDVDSGPDHQGRAAEKYPDATLYRDWRKLLDAEKVDAVIVSTPDHMHAPVALAAMRRGLHVYCQKPLTHTIAEARLMTHVAEANGLTTQMGNQIQSYAEYRTAVQLVHEGAIGKVHRVYSWQAGTPRWPRAIDRPAGADPIPKTLMWDNWLGVAPERPYKEKIYHPFNWRGWQDFSNGQLGDFGCHILDPVFMSLDLTAPVSIQAQAPKINSETWTESVRVEYVFPHTSRTSGDKAGLKVTWIDGPGHKPADELKDVIDPAKLPGSGSMLLGEKGSLLIPHVGTPKLLPEEQFVDYKMPQLKQQASHYVLWADACRGEGTTKSNFTYAGNLTETVLLGTIALRLPGTKLSWDAKSMKIAGHDRATAMLSKEYRKGWELG